jgi:aldehyde dehydrogenase (NAD+)
MVRRMGDYLREHAAEVARVLTLEAGKPLWESKVEIEGAARYFEYYGNQAETLEGRSIPLGQGYLDFTVYEPYGVSAQIIPWNYPLEMAARSMAPALAAGNACVVKTPELDPLSSAWLAKAAEAVGLPEGAVNILCGLGPEAGAALSRHRKIGQMVFTGSVETGTRIATEAARNVVPCVLEFGGKSAGIVWPDADMDAVMSSIRWGIYFNAGQVCSALSRGLVHESIDDEIVERSAALANGLSVGPGIEREDLGDTMGAMISPKQRDRAETLCRAAESEGARVARSSSKSGYAGGVETPFGGYGRAKRPRSTLQLRADQEHRDSPEAVRWKPCQMISSRRDWRSARRRSAPLTSRRTSPRPTTSPALSRRR